MSILLLQGIPFSNQFWEPIIQRLHHHQLICHTWNYLEISGDLQELLQQMHQFCQQHNITTIVAHGFAVPLAWKYCEQYPMESLIVSNGYLHQQGLNQMLLKSFNHLPDLLKEQLLRPAIALPILASSAIFRRLVINPYVMNYDNIVLLCQEQLQQKSIRKNLCQYLQNLNNWSISTKIQSGRIQAIWGDVDPLFPIDQIPKINIHQSIELKIIEGAAHFHPIERPWALADRIAQREQNSQ